MRLLFLGSVVAALLLVVPAGASTISDAEIRLSEMSSEQEEGGTPPNVLNAVVKFTVVDSTLTLDVNNTSNYDIVDLYFNSSDYISNLSIIPPTHADWRLGGHRKAGGLGTYDHHVTVTGNFNKSSATIQDGTWASLVFSFDCVDVDVCSVLDFAAINGDKGKALAAKFVNGGDAFGDPDDSAFGASPSHMPEPGTGALLGLGLVALARARRC
jgi:hypothetical protein